MVNRVCPFFTSSPTEAEGDDAPRIGREYLYAFSAFGWPRRGCGAMAHPMRSSADPSAIARVPSW
jgi:hypothetical protein